MTDLKNSNSMANTVPAKAYDVIILGAGAAGLMAAITAAQRGRRVAVLEVSNKPGKKILMSGGGRCNFTNLEISANEYICANPHFVKSALKQYTQWDFIAMVAAHDIPYHEKEEGQLFCDSSSKDILAMLISHCDTHGVEIFCDTETFAVDNSFELTTNRGRFESKALIVATGGLSIPTLGGASGFAYDLAKHHRIPVNELEASLVPFTLTGKWQQLSTQLAGVSLPVRVSTARKSFELPMLFTHRGISGPAVLQLSNYWYLGDEIEINLVPDEEAGEWLIQKKQDVPNQSIVKTFGELLPKSVASALIEFGWLAEGRNAADTLHTFKKEELKEIGRRLNRWRLAPSGTEGYRTAEVTRGGIDVNHLSSKTMQVNDVPGLYMIGEAVDVTGHLGGYNFQWAWSSGYVAGRSV